jgi:hypothetical protein
VFRYDPSGLRSAMTSNWTSLRKSLVANRPDHLPVPVWEKRPVPSDAQAKKSLEAQGLPMAGLARKKSLKGWGAAHAELF